MARKIYEQLIEIVPAQVSRFTKLNENQTSTYAFLRYDIDLMDQYCLHYRNLTDPTFPERHIVLDELDELLATARRKELDMISLKLFRSCCPRSSKHPTGYTIAVRLLEHLGLGRHFGQGLVLY